MGVRWAEVCGEQTMAGMVAGTYEQSYLGCDWTHRGSTQLYDTRECRILGAYRCILKGGISIYTVYSYLPHSNSADVECLTELLDI